MDTVVTWEVLLRFKEEKYHHEGGSDTGADCPEMLETLHP